jgi:hypothetical protein
MPCQVIDKETADDKSDADDSHPKKVKKEGKKTKFKLMRAIFGQPSNL